MTQKEVNVPKSKMPCFGQILSMLKKSLATVLATYINERNKGKTLDKENVPQSEFIEIHKQVFKMNNSLAIHEILRFSVVDKIEIFCLK